jgi:hypothetical protein
VCYRFSRLANGAFCCHEIFHRHRSNTHSHLSLALDPRFLSFVILLEFDAMASRAEQPFGNRSTGTMTDVRDSHTVSANNSDTPLRSFANLLLGRIFLPSDCVALRWV